MVITTSFVDVMLNLKDSSVIVLLPVKFSPHEIEHGLSGHVPQEMVVVVEVVVLVVVVVVETGVSHDSEILYVPEPE